MPGNTITFLELRHQSPEFDAAYDLFSRDIPAQCLEEREFLRNRVRVRDRGPESEKDEILIQDGYTLHLIAAKEGGEVVGAIYGHLISRIGAENRGIGFVTYISVLPGQRRRGIGSMLVDQLQKRAEEDARRLTGKCLAGMVFEIEAEGKDAIKGLVRKRKGLPLDIDYYQPALRDATSTEPMHLWFVPLDPPLTSIEDAGSARYPVEFVHGMVLNMFVMEYVGPQMKGFDRSSMAYTKLLSSLEVRKDISFLR